jgi:hypothetical protein
LALLGVLVCLRAIRSPREGVSSAVPAENAPETSRGEKPPSPAPPSQQESSLPASGEKSLDAALEDCRLGKPVVVDNLAVIPIAGPGGQAPGEGYLTLAEALETKVVVVKELEGGGTVPKVEMESKAEKPIFIPFGAIITGGKQDRMTRDDIALAPGEKKQVAVYCVEQGRWSGEAVTIRTSLRSHPGSPGNAAVALRAYVGAGTTNREAKRRDIFKSSHNYMDYGGRAKGANRKSQGAVWDAVAKANTKLANPSGTSNFRGNFDTKAFKKAKTRLTRVQKALELDAKVGGIVVIVNGRVVACEIFASSAYFQKIWPQLFSGMVVDAASGKKKTEIDAAAAARKAREFLSAMQSAKAATEKGEGLLKVRLEGKTVVGSALVESGKGRLLYYRLFPREGEPGKKK